MHFSATHLIEAKVQAYRELEGAVQRTGAWAKPTHTNIPAADEIAQRLAAIVESSDDAILAKDLNGTIVSWNSGAERLFGYTADEAIGSPVTMLIPPDRADEEPTILARIRSGERIDHYETIRRRKDGSLIDISLSVSPIRGRDGEVIGASKIARDITARRRAEEQQLLLIREMDHRVKNLFTLAGSVVLLSARSARTVADLVSSVSSRLHALAQAHALTIPLVHGRERQPQDDDAARADPDHPGALRRGRR